ncbi:outer membrane beta-barrel protein [Bizionia paragorgiae]|uniref:Outer membrane protein beta-barrel domain-containing protein n=1 Tax=Bizionia paragorgiae TaxID=283786 RepID=A0A1H3XV52_BIZPA|nr:outer membrane beta-barrel protein [Bizionia paragorgiae]SEA02504.1 Outer membrane protein beta-barrel domain-containing protein [Bizionia paragorgiae]
MKKLFLCAALVAFGVFSVNAQGQFKIGANVGLPVGDFSDFYSLSAGLDVAYLIDVSDDFKVGGATGFMNVFGDDVETSFGDLMVVAEAEDAQFVPLAAAARFMASDNFYIGADLGYAIAVDSEGEGGVYYRPRIGYNFTEKIGVNLSYTGISNDGNSLTNIGVGVEFSL